MMAMDPDNAAVNANERRKKFTNIWSIAATFTAENLEGQMTM